MNRKNLTRNKAASINLSNVFYPLVPDDGDGKFSIRKDGKKFYTTLFGGRHDARDDRHCIRIGFHSRGDGHFSRDRMVIYTSNIFAVLGLRSSRSFCFVAP